MYADTRYLLHIEVNNFFKLNFVPLQVVQPNPRSIPKSMPLLLPTPKKKEYLQLKMKLEMHERKKRLRTHSSKNCLSTSSSPERSRQPTPEKVPTFFLLECL